MKLLTDKEMMKVTLWRLRSNVNKRGPIPDKSNPHYDGIGRCWQWTGPTNWGGYGIIYHERRTQVAHRVMWKIIHGPIPPGIQVLHRCDNPACINPSHLWLGSNRDNVSDRHAKGRDGAAFGDANGSRRFPELRRRGIHHDNAKLTDEQVREIRRRFQNGNVTKASLARRFKVCNSLVGMVIAKQIWRHVS